MVSSSSKLVDMAGSLLLHFIVTSCGADTERAAIFLYINLPTSINSASSCCLPTWACFMDDKIATVVLSPKYSNIPANAGEVSDEVDIRT